MSIIAGFTVSRQDNGEVCRCLVACLVAHLAFRVCFQEAADGTGDIYMSRFHRQKGNLTPGPGNED